MYYSIRHKTRYRYGRPISESYSEVRMQPRSEGPQRCVQFELSTTPNARIQSYRDYLGNIVHHFDIPASHRQLTITAEALVFLTPPEPLPSKLDDDTWSQLDELAEAVENWDFLAPSKYARDTPLLDELARDVGALNRHGDPLSFVKMLNTAIYDHFDYAPQTTRVDSPIDEALAARRGVCQDFAHIFIALLRKLRIPARYVSGYLYHSREDHDRSEQDATHAWVEVLLPALGWVGFDPTNNLIAGQRHIRTAVGRDYADVSPTRGIYRGRGEVELEVGVRVAPSEAPLPDEELLPVYIEQAEILQQQEQAQQ
jgi:transglutaminase-like putative cysteine protease